MSRIFYYPDGDDDLEVFCGWEVFMGKDLGYFFLVISRYSGPNTGYNTTVWSNLKDHKGPAMTIDDIARVLVMHQIVPPKSLLETLEADKMNHSNETTYLNECRHQ